MINYRSKSETTIKVDYSSRSETNVKVDFFISDLGMEYFDTA